MSVFDRSAGKGQDSFACAIRSEFGGLSRRTWIAISCGFAITVGGVSLIGPNLTDVFAQEMDQRQVYLNIMNHDRGGGGRPASQISPSASLPALFGLVGGRHGARPPAMPNNVRAYAPLPEQYQLQRPPVPRQPIQRGRLIEPIRPPIQAAPAPRGGLTSPVQPSAGYSPSVALLARRSVCVRLCDGFAFPVANYNGDGDNAAHSAICSGMCPGAPTRLYVAPAGSDKLEDMISVKDRKPYPALPVAFRFSTTHDMTCSCRAPGESVLNNVSLAKDFTLRTGDKIMTERGFRVFGGAARWPYRRDNFTTLARAGLDRNEFRILSALERVSLAGAAASTPLAKPFTARSMVKSPEKPTETADKSMRVLGPQVFLDIPSSTRTALP